MSSLRVEGHINCQKRSLVFVSILQSVAAAEIVNALHWRDFRSRTIFEFFNTIGQKRPFHNRSFGGLSLRRNQIISA